MVRAILEGRKTQTRRVGKCQKDDATELGVEYIGHATKGTVAQATYRAFPNGGTARWALCECHYGVPGDRLWVKETHYRWGKLSRGKWRFRPDALGLERDGGLVPAETRTTEGWHKRPSVFMPLKMSRITLEIVNLRVERLKDISEEDAKSEGTDYPAVGPCSCYRMGYSWLWDSINGKKHPWKKNPWVWVISFRRLTPAPHWPGIAKPSRGSLPRNGF